MDTQFGEQVGGEKIGEGPLRYWSEHFLDFLPITKREVQFLRNLKALFDVPKSTVSVRESPDDPKATRFSIVTQISELTPVAKGRK